ncbi:hypothetical protein [Terriglobus saanensis]|uniref:hypothetical protein n=1 Tax=Terriglobus saanensis TaxID=870903 RepID=UPI0003262838|nr:hypothetical protein [Terriglobus saanensis]
MSKGDATEDDIGSDVLTIAISTSAEGRGASGNSSVVCWAETSAASPQNSDPQKSVRQSAGRKWDHSL